MRSLIVQLGDRSYPIYIEAGLLERAEIIVPTLPGHDVLIVTNETIAPLYLESLLSGLGDLRVESLILPDGEKFKTLDTLNRIFDCLLEHRYSRDCTLIALGGGVVGDITGFAAASYQRGVAFVQVATTLLAQVDSSVGGKTGVNHARGKNMIGAFHQPRAVLADPATLNTLADRELSAGVAEIIKYGLICDSEFFDWLEENIEALLARDVFALTTAIKRSCEIKAEIVSADEREGGTRALLNLGHTFAHAIENALGYGEWLHGEAVGVGLYLAAHLSTQMGWMGAEQMQRLERLLKKAHLPTTLPPGVTPAQIVELMKRDKKVVGGAIRLILLKGIGQALITSEFEPARVVETLEQATRFS